LRPSAGRNTNNYSLVLRQSCIKQQSTFAHWPFDLPKHGVQPSAIWIQWIISAFFIFPGVTPSPLAFSFMSAIVILFGFTFVAGIFFLSLLSGARFTPTHGSPWNNQKPDLNSPDYQLSTNNYALKTQDYLFQYIPIEHFAQGGEKKRV